MVSSKFSDVIQGRSFWVSIISLILMAFAANHVDVTIYNSGAIYDLFTNKATLGALISFAIEIASKVFVAVQANGWNFSFIKSTNFQIAVSSILILILGSFFGQIIASLVAAIILESINIFYHLMIPLPVTPVIVNPVVTLPVATPVVTGATPIPASVIVTSVPVGIQVGIIPTLPA